MKDRLNVLPTDPWVVVVDDPEIDFFEGINVKNKHKTR